MWRSCNRGWAGLAQMWPLQLGRVPFTTTRSSPHGIMNRPHLPTIGRTQCMTELPAGMRRCHRWLWPSIGMRLVCRVRCLAVRCTCESCSRASRSARVWSRLLRRHLPAAATQQRRPMGVEAMDLVSQRTSWGPVQRVLLLHIASTVLSLAGTTLAVLLLHIASTARHGGVKARPMLRSFGPKSGLCVWLLRKRNRDVRGQMLRPNR